MPVIKNLIDTFSPSWCHSPFIVAMKLYTTAHTGISSITEKTIEIVCSHCEIGPCSMWCAPVHTYTNASDQKPTIDNLWLYSGRFEVLGMK